MTDQFCMCGTQPGYRHTETCPFPCYEGNEARQARWIAENKERVKEWKSNPKPKENQIEPTRVIK